MSQQSKVGLLCSQRLVQKRMKEWIVVPAEHEQKWGELARQAQIYAALTG
jgi:hypothetical protein